MKQSKKYFLVEGTIGDAISAGFSGMQELAEEIREVVDSAEGGLAETSRIQTLSETADELEGQNFDDEPDLPDWVLVRKVSWAENRRKSISRSTRRDNAVNALCAAIDGIRDAAVVASEDDEELEQELEQIADEIEEKKDAADGVEFPGMYG